MDNALKSLENNALAALTQRAPQGVVSAIKTASAKTGVSFSYLMEKAAAESNFNPIAKAGTSSATGLFQFIESTWMDMINKHGDKYGIDKNQSKSALLNLRKDPEIASLMAAEFADGNKAHLKTTIGGDIGNTELYFAHFMGAGGASGFLSQLKKNPLSIGADLFPKEARANRNVFYDRDTGQPRTLQQIYDFFDKKFSGETATTNPETFAHNPRRTKDGYQHIPFSLKKPIEIQDAASAYSRNSLYAMERQIAAFFTQDLEATSQNLLPLSFYSKLASPSSIFLNLLK